MKILSLTDWVFVAFFALVALGGAQGCGAGLDPRDPAPRPRHAIDSDVQPASGLVMPEPEEFKRTALLVAPDPELVPAVQEVIDSYWQTFGIEIHISPIGIVIGLVSGLNDDGRPVDGLAHFDRYCSGYDCDPQHGVFIKIDDDLLGDKSWGMQATMLHELGHVLSGWGHAAHMGMHLASGVGVMSPGCVGGVCMPWSDADAEMICAGVLCQWLDLQVASE